MSNRDWFVDKMSLTNSIDKLTSLPVNMQYLGWSNMKYTCGLNIKHLVSHINYLTIEKGRF